MSARRVVVTGLGPITPIGVGAADFWSHLLEAHSGIRTITSFDPARFDSRIAGEIEGVKVGDYVPKSYRKAGKVMARDIVLAVAAAHAAVTDSGLHTRCLIDRGEADGSVSLDSTRFGANIGAGLICADLAELSEALHSAAEGEHVSLAKWGAEGMQNLTPLWLLKFLPNMLACHVTIVHDAQGPSNTITCGEASSHLAIGEAFRTLARGVADVCICGGAESKTNPMALVRQSLGKRVSTSNDNPAQACRPFGCDRDGTVVSEGGGLVILEELEHARARGARIYCELIGFGASNDAYDPRMPGDAPPDGRGLALACRKALKDAGVAPADVDCYGAFACGLVDRDACEAAAVQAVFGARAAETPVLPARGGIGNNGAGSGAIDFIATILALHHNTLPPALNSDPIDGDLAVRLNTSGAAQDCRIDVAISAAYALSGGQNAALVIRKFAE